jgi:hypothetical protein
MIRSDLVWRIAPNDRLFWMASQLAKTIAPVAGAALSDTRSH